MPDLVTMSQNELHRLEAIQKIRDRRMSVVQAADLLALSRSQVHRLLQAYDLKGVSGIVSRRRGQPSNRRHDEEFRNAALDLVRSHYRDFGPTLACEKLIERHQIAVSKETLRHWMAVHESLDSAMCHKEFRTLSQALTLRYDKVLFILDPTEAAKRIAGKKVIVCDYPDGRLEIMHQAAALPYRTFDKLRSVHRTAIVENKRLDAALTIVAEMQEGRELKRSQHAPRRTGQTDHMFGIPDGSVGNGYVKRGRKPGRRTDFVNDPEVIARREQALARLAAAKAASKTSPTRVDDILAVMSLMEQGKAAQTIRTPRR